MSWSFQRDPLGLDSVSSTYTAAGRLSAMTGAGNSGTRTDSWRDYDQAGNNTRSADQVVLPSTTTLSSSRSYYGADQRLRFLQVLGTSGVTAKKQEFRYDALGRRVLLRTQLPNCSGTCPAAIERFVWDGDQLLYELRAPDGSAAALETAFGNGTQYGKVAYVHGLEIDQPIGLYRSSYMSSTQFLVPHANWRGHFQTGTDASGTICCSAIDWPAPKMHTFMEAGASQGDWMGSLIQDQRDMSGLMYRRNRYYDPNTGRFTQEDPLGLAGGLNLYGFADGDPVNFSDPMGLSPLGKIIKLTVAGAKTLMKGADEAAMVRNLAEGEDVVAGSQQAASRIARAAGGGKRPVGPEAHKLPGGSQGRSHYHPAGRTGGHVFYSIASGLTLSHYAEGRGALLEGAAAIGDFFNPLSVAKDAIDVYDMVKPAKEETVNKR